MVDLVPVEDYKDVGLLSNLINRHVLYTGSEIGDEIVNDFSDRAGGVRQGLPARLPPGAGAEQGRAAAMGADQWLTGVPSPVRCTLQGRVEDAHG